MEQIKNENMMYEFYGHEWTKQEIMAIIGRLAYDMRCYWGKCFEDRIYTINELHELINDGIKENINYVMNVLDGRHFRDNENYPTYGIDEYEKYYYAVCSVDGDKWDQIEDIFICDLDGEQKLIIQTNDELLHTVDESFIQTSDTLKAYCNFVDKSRGALENFKIDCDGLTFKRLLKCIKNNRNITHRKEVYELAKYLMIDFTYLPVMKTIRDFIEIALGTTPKVLFIPNWKSQLPDKNPCCDGSNA